MDETNASDRQLASVINRRVGPARPVDDAAIFSAITTSPSRRWGILPKASIPRPFDAGDLPTATAAATTRERRFPTMLSATKFVVAGAIVALFGGFLLSGVLTPQRDEVTPAAVSPSPTADVLSTLETAEVAPGVLRVLSDGYRGLDENVSYVATTREGDIWVLKQNRGGKDVRIVRVGQPGVAYRPKGSSGKEIFGARLVTGDGTIGYAQGGYDVPAVLESGEWVTNKGSNYDDCVRLFGGVAADGTCFDYEDYASPRILGDDGGVSQSAFGRSSLFGRDIRLGKPVSRDGIVWQPAVGSGRLANTFEGLARYDGESWVAIPYPEEDARPVSGPVAVALDGVVWVPSYVDGEGLTMITWDGDVWRSFGPLAVPRANPEAHFHPDGSATLGVLATFDGTLLKRLELPDQVVRDVYTSALAPDGSTWAIRDGGLYVFTPEATTAAET